MVFVRPNDSFVKARLKKIKETDMEKKFVWMAKLEILESDNIEDLANFTKDKLGEKIDVYFIDTRNKKIGLGDVIFLNIQYLGDEWGGKFVGKICKI